MVLENTVEHNDDRDRLDRDVTDNELKNNGHTAVSRHKLDRMALRWRYQRDQAFPCEVTLVTKAYMVRKRTLHK